MVDKGYLIYVSNFNKGGTEVPYIVIKRFVNSKKDAMVYISVEHKSEIEKLVLKHKNTNVSTFDYSTVLLIRFIG